MIDAIRRNCARFSGAAAMNASIRIAIAAIVAEVRYTAFAAEGGLAVTARLVVRRVRDLNKQPADG